MPCNTVITNTVNLTNVKNHALLEAAIKSLYGDVRRDGDRFQFKVNGYLVTVVRGAAESRLPAEALQDAVAKIKQAYARKAVELAAKRFGWAVTKGTDVNNFHIQKGA